MKKHEKFAVTVLLLVAVCGFLAIVTEMPTVSANEGGGKYCNDSATKYCWTSLPNWECLDAIGGIKCVYSPGS